MIAFASAVILLTATPGPGVLTLAGVGVGFGWRSGLLFGIGILVGTNLVAAAAASGLAAAVLADERLRIVLAVLSVSYLLYLAARIALAGRRIADAAPGRAPGILGGILLQAINPKAYAVNAAYFSGFELGEPLATEIAIKFLICNLVFVPVHLGWLWAGVTLGRLDVPPRVGRFINVAMALAMVAAVALALTMGNGRGVPRP